jgi:hypothetical protein
MYSVYESCWEAEVSPRFSSDIPPHDHESDVLWMKCMTLTKSGMLHPELGLIARYRSMGDWGFATLCSQQICGTVLGHNGKAIYVILPRYVHIYPSVLWGAFSSSP